MPAWLCEHPGGDLRFPDLLQGHSYQRQSLSVGMDEYRCWLLQEEDTWDLLSKRHLSTAAHTAPITILRQVHRRWSLLPSPGHRLPPKHDCSA